MLDPFPFAAPAALQTAVQPLADYFSLQTLPLHIHEVLFAFALYHITYAILSPTLSRWLFPRIYPALNKRTQLNWDVHVVSLVQSTLVNALALWVSAVDDERGDMNWVGRVWGYTGAGGLVQGFACGYFLWDLWISLRYVRIFGVGLLAHAVSALAVFSLGFRPFVNFYGPTFILYELSSPFLNVHWFCDKLNLTGSKIQLYNGFLLLGSFFGARLCWGSYQSYSVFKDVYRALSASDALNDSITNLDHNLALNTGIMRFAPSSADELAIPLWLAAVYLAANLTLNALNWYWFSKMIETVRKRFAPPLGTKKEHAAPAAILDADAKPAVATATGSDALFPAQKRHTTPLRRARDPVLIEGIDLDTDNEVPLDASPEVSPEAGLVGAEIKQEVLVARGLTEDGRRSVEVQQTRTRTLRPRRRG
ncbi:uncharacterized protein K452DRAFT_290996 [Aplosporella prunicola CBS 121167]|uniref:TLC domain-containing protein n=1 Tax=Aplosporella prunicola CBS 121167 TaxID=1176127 RepID=A0A6A6B1B4_9PEZI|nr:uncharacterized protein K452DRAFT_290996 [Aplosporella prunicola CBS 121167]KAF2137959.1 hypothetical protein K452DRAFT_290996 [Aplosporella prunicola CBS 121167]